jgi:hypothetical protein
MIRRICIHFSWLLLIANILLGCKSKESLPATVSNDSSKVKTTERVINPPTWVDVVSSEGDTLKVDQVADFGMGCPRASDLDIDGKFRDGCPLRAEKWGNLDEYSSSVAQKSSSYGNFRRSVGDHIDCNEAVLSPVDAYLNDSIVVFRIIDFFDSIQVSYQNQVAYFDFKGYVDPEKRGYPKPKNSGGEIADGGMGNAPESILILKSKTLAKIVMTSPNGIIRGDYLVKNRTLIPVSKKSLWPCKYPK